MNKKISSLFLTAMIILLSPIGFSRADRESLAAERIRIGIPARNSSFWPLFVADDQKFYEAEGLAVETVLIQGGAARGIQIMLAGDLDFGIVGTVVSLAAYLRGAPVVVVSGLLRQSPFQLYGVPEIRSLADLKGRAIASGAVGGPPHFVVALMLRSVGLDPKKDVRQINIAGGANRLAVMEQKQVHAAVLEPPFSFRAIEMGFRKLADAREYLPDDQNTAVATRVEMLQRNPDTVRRFLRALNSGMKFVTSRREVSIRTLGKYTAQPRSTLEATYDFLVPTFSQQLSEKGILSIRDYLVDFGVIAAPRDLKGFVDLRLLP